MKLHAATSLMDSRKSLCFSGSRVFYAMNQNRKPGERSFVIIKEIIQK